MKRWWLWFVAVVAGALAVIYGRHTRTTLRAAERAHAERERHHRRRAALERIRAEESGQAETYARHLDAAERAAGRARRARERIEAYGAWSTEDLARALDRPARDSGSNGRTPPDNPLLPSVPPA